MVEFTNIDYNDHIFVTLKLKTTHNFSFKKSNLINPNGELLIITV